MFFNATDMLVALLTVSWKEFASVLLTVPADERQIMVALECFGVSAMEHLLRTEPSLRPLLKAAVFEKFKSGEFGKRYYVVSEICLFAPEAWPVTAAAHIAAKPPFMSAEPRP